MLEMGKQTRAAEDVGDALAGAAVGDDDAVEECELCE